MKYNEQTEYWVNPQTGEARYDFDIMYKDISDPWGCAEGINSLENKVFLDIIFQQNKSYENILDVGCGLGTLSNEVYQRNLNYCEGNLTAVDISNNAIIKAQKSYPKISFIKVDLLNDDFDWGGKFNLIILAETLWYLVADIKGVFTKINKYLCKDGVVAIKQYFPKNQKYFNKYINGPDHLTKILSKLDFIKKSIVTINNNDRDVICFIYKK